MTQTIAERIVERLENSYEISQAELASSLGLSRDAVRKPVSKLVEQRKIERRIDAQGIAWLCVTGSQASYAEDAEYTEDAEYEMGLHSSDYDRGFSQGYQQGVDFAWIKMGLAIAKKIRALLDVDGKEEE